MVVDDSFKKPGAIPFKWEIRPGVPKLQHSHQQHYQSSSSSYDEEFSFPVTPRKLAPPPHASVAAAGYCYQTGSFRSTPPPRSRSSRFRFHSSNNNKNNNNNINNVAQLQHVEVSAASGCFPSPLLMKRRSEETKKKHKTSKETAHEDVDSATAGSSSDLETLSPLTGRLSVSSRSSSWKSLSPLRDSPLSSSFSSYRYSTPPPRRVSNDFAEWASFGLF